MEFEVSFVRFERGVRRQLRQKIAAAFGKTMVLKRCGTHPHVRRHWEFQCGAPEVKVAK